ncbi:MAG: hypothetical protein CO163_08135 [Rhodobacterales bacterium CG_4_9_14_3_um_filter_71_31]|nr:MAG: hypothetical protein CO163_08135 [Rhodobacterales bacterium CG_4_9_14_3_um_filter_71_31]
MANRWKHDRPLSCAQFEARFPGDAACAAYLAARRWPEGLVCPSCGGAKGWALKTRAHTWECAACRRQTSVTAGTVTHGGRLSLKARASPPFIRSPAIPTASPPCNCKSSRASAATRTRGCS